MRHRGCVPDKYIQEYVLEGICVDVNVVDLLMKKFAFVPAVHWIELLNRAHYYWCYYYYYYYY